MLLLLLEYLGGGIPRLPHPPSLKIVLASLPLESGDVVILSFLIEPITLENVLGLLLSPTSHRQIDNLCEPSTRLCLLLLADSLLSHSLQAMQCILRPLVCCLCFLLVLADLVLQETYLLHPSAHGDSVLRHELFLFACSCFQCFGLCKLRHRSSHHFILS